MRKISLFVILVAMLVLAITGCGPIVRPSDAALIDTSAANARAFNARVQADPAAPDYVKRWQKADTAQWNYLSDWANGRKPVAATQP